MKKVEIFTMTFETTYDSGSFARLDKRLTMACTMEQREEVKQYAEENQWRMVSGRTEWTSEYVAAKIGRRRWQDLFEEEL
jgi:hypothetical protein